ncbi:DNA primase [Flavobacterium sp. ZB4R12]|uniref:DNA primase n=1 Tax=Flavobacterium sp. ZB4R12 TaxID=3398732 RepID=UPI003AAA6585
MKRVIVDYAKLTNEILNLLVEKFPDGYDDSDIIRFRNAKNELIEAVEVRTEDTIYLVKVSTKLADRIENYDEDDDIDAVVEPISGLELDDDDDDSVDDDDDSADDDDDDDNLDKPDSDTGDDGDDDDDDIEDKDISDEDDEDDED